MSTIEMLSQVLGGIGLFLIGMVLTTDGLRAAAGDSLRRTLLRYTGGPLQAMMSGAVVTAMVQSSSATTVATISFVTAGLLTFQQALGLILGANIGTTATGWIVALLGLKFSVSNVALPLVGIGALVRLFGRGRWTDIGLALAGFGVLFVGLDVLQAGMAGVSAYVTPEMLPSDSWLGRLALVGIGIALTALMQSSSAAIATTLTALDAGTISMMQAAAMAIGVNIGTTVTAGLAVIGAGTAARRTAFAHLAFNLLTGTVAFVSLPLLVQAVLRLESDDPTLALAAFHTIFNLVGVALIYPFIGRFASYVERVIVERGPRLTHLLEPSLVDEGGLAIEAVRQTTFGIAREVVATADAIIFQADLGPEVQERLEEQRQALDATHAFIASLRDLDNVGPHSQQRHVDAIHALDYLDQLLDMLRHEGRSLARETPPAALPIFALALEALDLATPWLAAPGSTNPSAQLEQLSVSAAAARKEFREHVLDETARGAYSAVDAARDIDLVRRLDEFVYHLWRFSQRLREDEG